MIMMVIAVDNVQGPSLLASYVKQLLLLAAHSINIFTCRPSVFSV